MSLPDPTPLIDGEWKPKQGVTETTSITVDDMLARTAPMRIAALVEHHRQMAALFPESFAPLTRRQRITRRVEDWRERLAVRIAPWLDHEIEMNRTEVLHAAARRADVVEFWAKRTAGPWLERR